MIADLFTGSGVASTVLMLAISIFAGLLLGKIKVKGVTLGITWVLFVGIALSACGVSLNDEMLHIVKEFGLILFVTGVGLQVGPGFFSSFKKGGLSMNVMALVNVALGVGITVLITHFADQELSDMAGVYTGAITNTPGLSAAQEAVKAPGVAGDPGTLAAGYAVAYPLAVVGMIVTCILLRPLCRIDLKNEPTTVATADANTGLSSKKKGGILLIPTSPTDKAFTCCVRWASPSSSPAWASALVASSSIPSRSTICGWSTASSLPWCRRCWWDSSDVWC